MLTGVDDQGRPITAPFDATATVERESNPAPRKVTPDRATSSLLPDSNDSDTPF